MAAIIKEKDILSVCVFSFALEIQICKMIISRVNGFKHDALINLKMG